MILRRLADAIRDQNWFTVVLEILIVVIGIFIGLQVDDWNRARQNRALEQEYMVRLAEDIRSDIVEFDGLEQIFEIKARMIQEIRDLPVAEVFARRADQLPIELDYTTWKALPRVQSATFAELSSSGRLVLLSNSALRSALSDYYAGYALMSDILSEPDNDYRRFLYGAIPGEIVFEMRVAGIVTEVDRLADAMTELKALPGFEEAANSEIAYAGSLIFYLHQFNEQANRLLGQIEASMTRAEQGP